MLLPIIANITENIIIPATILHAILTGNIMPVCAGAKISSRHYAANGVQIGCILLCRSYVGRSSHELWAHRCPLNGLPQAYRKNVDRHLTVIDINR